MWHKLGVERDLNLVVRNQLPAGIRTKLAVSVRGDAYHLCIKASFVDDRKRVWECELETMEFEGVDLHCKIPDAFLAQLCAVV